MRRAKVFDLMKKTIALLAVILLNTSVYSQVTINLEAEKLKTSTSAGGGAMPTSGLAILVASTLDSTFGGPSSAAYATGDDVVVGAWNLTGGFNTAGVLTSTVNTTPTGNWNAGDLLQLYWFPTLTLAQYNASNPPGNNTAYGQYRDPATVTPLEPGGNLWVTPSSGGLINIKFYTVDASNLIAFGAGQSPAAAGLADFTTAPEPSTYAAIFGGLCLVAGIVRRQYSRRHA